MPARRYVIITRPSPRSMYSTAQPWGGLEVTGPPAFWITGSLAGGQEGGGLNNGIDAKGSWFYRFSLAVPSQVHDGRRAECCRGHEERATGRSRLRAHRQLRWKDCERQEPAEVAAAVRLPRSSG